jgi:hypothetical protein
VREPRQRPMVTILLDLAFRRSGQIEPLRADPRIYDHVLFLAPSWNRHIATPMRAAMRHLAPEVGAYSFVTLCGGDRPRQSDTCASRRPPRPDARRCIKRRSGWNSSGPRRKMISMR